MLIKWFLIAVLILGQLGMLESAAKHNVSRVYVDAYPCATSGKLNIPGRPTVTLFDRLHYGDAQYKGEKPRIKVISEARGASHFYFDVRPGSYDAFIKFQNVAALSIANGPLVVIGGSDRHLFVAGCNLVDWHDVATIAGRMPLKNVTVSILKYDQPMRCGDDISTFDRTAHKWITPQRTPTVIDSGAYYGNFHAYGGQDNSIALAFSGALFTGGAILLRKTPDVPANRPPFIIKNLTPRIVQLATREHFKLVCAPGF